MTESFPRLRARTARFTNGAPHSFRIVKAANVVLYLQSPGPFSSSQRLLQLKLDVDANPEVLVDAADLQRAETDLPAAEKALRERLRESAGGITSFSVDDAGKWVVFALAGVVHALERGTRELHVVPKTQAAINPKISPTGNHVAWISEGNIWIAPTQNLMSTTQLTQTREGQTWGLANFLAAEEFDRTTGFWWSPDGTQLLVEHVDEANVESRFLADPSDPSTPPREIRYPAAGTPNPRVCLWLLSLDGSAKQLHWDADRYEYLVSVNWTARGPALINVYDRRQRHSCILALIDGELVAVAEGQDSAWVSDLPGTPNWTKSGELVQTWRGENTESVSVSGVPVELPGGNVTALLGVTDAGLVLEIAPDATTRTVVCTNGTDFYQLLPASGYATAVVAEDVLVSRTTDFDSQTWIRRASRWAPAQPLQPIVTVPDQSMVPPVDIDLVHLRLGPDEIHTVVVWPPESAGERSNLPIIMNPYGGPHAQLVLAAGRSYHKAAWLAQHGFAVVIADGRGTPGRGPRWERSIRGDLASAALADQVCVLEELALQFPTEFDTSRVGISGWSYGGYLAGLAVLDRPDIFRCAIAGAPVTDWRWYDTAYTERYLGMPAEESANYDACSLIPRAASLSRPLMIIHGLADDNVLAQHSLRLSAALTAAGRMHTFLPLPNVSHMTPQVDIAENLLNLELEFFADHLDVR